MDKAAGFRKKRAEEVAKYFANVKAADADKDLMESTAKEYAAAVTKYNTATVDAAKASAAAGKADTKFKNAEKSWKAA